MRRGSNSYDKYDDTDTLRHFPDDEYIRQINGRSYRLKDHEKENIRSIKSRLEGNISEEELFEYKSHLQELAFRLKEIIKKERDDELTNIELENDLRTVTSIIQKINSRLK